MTALPAQVSIVVPTFDEADNIHALLTRIAAAVPDGIRAEVVFADDSTDDTCAVIEKEAARFPFPVVPHHRPEPVGGLGGAVVEGFARGSAPWIVVMDADLQHPPELIFELVARGEATGAELVVATRYAAGGDRGGLAGGYRRLVSSSSTLLAKALFPRALGGLTDPMSGFFAIRRTAVDRAATEDEGLQPLGYKILLELAVRCRPRGIAEVPYAFGERHAGTSKSTPTEGLRFLRHLITLRTADPRARAVVFGLVGLSGFVPNLALLWLLTVTAPGLPYAPAEIIANQAGLLWNFALIDSFVYRNQRRHHRRSLRLLTFAGVGNADLVARIPLAALLIAGAGMSPLPATALGMAIVFTARFLVVDRWLYRRLRGRTTAPVAVPGAVAAVPGAVEAVPGAVPDPLG
ncbi:glycosyltransferase [Streptomyces echinatus]|uniref:Dolichol-phosphate mannosyltransferase n=1 Tax=Streptomyces echinatus TaxID=67293 RepID=A0A7W9UQM0_9ACTN|nr:glycosyltransferase family 2 protein [Streptomyces echinatus]MBB5927572.1 dolichol-phosphate mannosyltransferase [Streptomyces echinatus]